MVINRYHLPWALLVLVLSALGGVLYLANFLPQTLPFAVHLPREFGPVPPNRHTVGGTPLGLLFGSVSLGIFLFASALGIRKKRRTWPLGNVQGWLRAHIWLTILTIPFVGYHCGFQMGGPMTSTLLVLYAIVMGSGFFGLALQQFMPTLMTQRLPREVVFEQIPHVHELLISAAEELWRELAPSAHKAAPVLAATGGGLFPESEDPSQGIIGRFLHDECFPYLRARDGSGHRLAQEKAAEDIFRLLRLHVTERWRAKVDLMYQWCADRRLLDVQKRLHFWLHSWLFIHVPLSFALLVVTVWHAYVTLLYL